MSYELSFSPEFFFGDNDDDPALHPTTVRAAVFAFQKRQPDGWIAMCEEVFPNVPVDRVDVEMVMSKIRDTNSCSDLRSPVSVWIDEHGWYQVLVYDEAHVKRIEQNDLPPVDPKHLAHFLAIQSVLGTTLAQKARDVMAELTPKEMRTWLDELSKLSVPDAVKKLKKMF